MGCRTVRRKSLACACMLLFSHHREYAVLGWRQAVQLTRQEVAICDEISQGEE